MLDVFRSIIRYLWQRFDFIIFVRYLMGTAYLPSPLHRIAFHLFSILVPTPSRVYFLDVPPEEAHKRITEARTEIEMFEGLERLKKIQHKARELVSLGRWTLVDGQLSPTQVHQRILTDFR